MDGAPRFRSNVGALGEFALLERLLRKPTADGGGYVGPGDDCAIIPVHEYYGGRELWQVITTDALVEDRHFRRATTSAKDLGWKLCAVSFSDVAAMGAAPWGVLLTLQLRPDTDLAWLEELYEGIYAAAQSFNTRILGGDTVAAAELSFSSTVVGFTERSPLTRRGAAPGDVVWISGAVGGSSLGLSLLERPRQEPLTAAEQEAVRRHVAPRPRVEIGRALLEQGLATAAIDLSDGLIQDARHLAVRSGVQVILVAADVPLADGIRRDEPSLCRAVTGGEDYELCFTAPPEKESELLELAQRTGIPLKPIGSIASGAPQVSVRSLSGVLRDAADWLAENGVSRRGGFDHFAG